MSADEIDGVVVRPLTPHGDERGRFLETFRQEWFPGAPTMVQGNHAVRRAGTVVGLHFHRRQADYWYLVGGRARAVLHDLRTGSPTEGATLHVELGVDHPLGLYIPPGVAHGFAALTDAELTYLVDRTYDPDDELGLAWDDPEVGADWGVAEPLLSARDRTLPSRSALAGSLPRHRALRS